MLTDTSLLAAESIQGSAPFLREQVFGFIEDKGRLGATDEEIQLGLGMNPSTERPRRGELVKAGRVVETTRRRPTASGRMAIVWELA